jgi:hypothetical protein
VELSACKGNFIFIDAQASRLSVLYRTLPGRIILPEQLRLLQNLIAF